MMKKWIWLCLFLLFLLPSAHTFAAGARLSDSAGLLSAQELAVAEKNLNHIVERYDVSVHLMTTEKIGKKDDYKAYVSKQRKKEKDKNLLLLLLSSKEGEELCYVKVYGNAGKNLTAKRLRKTQSAVERELKREDYKEAVHLLSSRLLDQMGTKPVFDGVLFHPFLHFLFFTLLSAGILYRLLKKVPSPEMSEKSWYLNEKYSAMSGTLDHYSHTSVKARKERKKRKKDEQEDEFSELKDDFE